MIKTENEYEAALLRQKQLTMEQEQLDKDVLEYQNKFKIPSYTNLKYLKDFIQYESQDDSLVNFKGVTYKVGGWEEMLIDYGSESAYDAMHEYTLEDLTDGILEKQWN